MTVYLVGAGPGDPGLLTLRAAELIASAEVLIHDRLIDARTIALAPPTALVIDVGKHSGSTTPDQASINALLVKHASSSQTVVRLKGGDPYVFGRGGEEAAALQEAGCAYEVVPGVPSFTAVASAGGVPITLRGVASSFVVLTGHDITAGDGSSKDIELFARSGATLVVMMGVATRAAIAERLMRAGRTASTPVLVVQDGTLPTQRTLRTNLGSLGTLEVHSPATIVIGAVADRSFAALTDRPLAGWRIVVTQAEASAVELTTRFEQAGAQVVRLPTIAIAEASDGGASLREAVTRIDAFDWVIFGSKNAVEQFFAVAHDARTLSASRVAAIGSATERVLGRYGVIADLIPKDFVAESLVDSFTELHRNDPRVQKALLPQSETGRDVIAVGLRGLGWEVDVIPAYRTMRADLPRDVRDQLLGADLITFTSSSAVEGALAGLAVSDLPKAASIGPVTSKTAAEAGLEVVIEASVHTLAGLVAAVIEFASEHPRSV